LGSAGFVNARGRGGSGGWGHRGIRAGNAVSSGRSWYSGGRMRCGGSCGGGGGGGCGGCGGGGGGGDGGGGGGAMSEIYRAGEEECDKKEAGAANPTPEEEGPAPLFLRVNTRPHVAGDSGDMIGEPILYKPIKFLFQHISRAFFEGFRSGSLARSVPSAVGYGW